MNLRVWINKFKIPSIVYFNWLGCVPPPSSRVNTVFGKKFPIPFIENPTDKDINYYHEKYIQNLIELFEKYVDRYDPGAKLIIVDRIKPKL